MNNDDLYEIVEDVPTPLIAGLKGHSIEGNVLSLDVTKDSLPEFAEYIQKKYHAWMISEHAVDLRQEDGQFHIFVLFSLPKGNAFVTLRTGVQSSLSTYRSLTPMVYAADWFEREMMDLFGLVPTGHPDARPLVLYDDWPYGVFPLRKDFDGSIPLPRVPSEYRYHHVDGEGVFEIPVGPVHAGVIEPGHFRFSVAGEPIINLEIRLGYAHRGVEKLSESLPYHRGVLLSERISGDNGFTHALAYCQAIEDASKAEVPERALFLRTIFSELERLYCHMGDIGGIALDTAFSTGAQMAYQIREEILRLNETLTGSRLLRSTCCLGGVHRDLGPEGKREVQRTLVKVKLDFDDFVQTISNMPSLLDRVETTGTLSLESARNLNVVGPVGRASGIDRDVRRDHPYAAYPQLSFNIPVNRDGDVWARTKVKMDEVLESISIVEQAVDRMPSGEICMPSFDIPKGVIGIGLVETHRGECMHWIMTGEGMPFRHKVRDASFLNWPALELAVLGNIIPDFPLINKSFNLSYAGNDL